jgi:Cu-Zn family superoxide dismutase
MKTLCAVGAGLILTAVGIAAAGPTNAADATTGATSATAASADMQNRDGATVGKATLTQTAHGVLLHIEMDGLAPGWHGIHIHGIGKCEPPFTSAGGHFNPAGHKHGFAAEGPHAGDLPNIHADSTGHASAEFLESTVSLEGDGSAHLIGPNGTAIVVHAGPDDMMTDPAGNSGDRIACGVIKK